MFAFCVTSILANLSAVVKFVLLSTRSSSPSSDEEESSDMLCSTSRYWFCSLYSSSAQSLSASTSIIFQAFLCNFSSLPDRTTMIPGLHTQAHCCSTRAGRQPLAGQEVVAVVAAAVVALGPVQPAIIHSEAVHSAALVVRDLFGGRGLSCRQESNLLHQYALTALMTVQHMRHKLPQKQLMIGMA